MKAPFAVFALLTLAACAPEPPAPVYIAPPPVTNGLVQREPDSCSLSKVQHLRGQPAGAVAAAQTDRATRVVPPGAMITQEYSAERVNFYLDDAGLIARIACG